MKKKLLYIFISVMTLGVIASCRKDAFEGTQTEESGTTFVRFVNHTDKAPINELYFTPFTDIKDVQLLDLRRDVHSNASLNTTLTLTLETDAAAIAAYNTANGTTFEALPESIYTLNAPGFTKTATGYTVTFNPGEFAKPLMIKLDGAQYDLNKKYAVAFKIGTITGDGTLTGVAKEKTIMTTIAIKNKYDGIYEISGTLTDANGLYIGYYPGSAYFDPADPRIYSLTTTSDNSVLFYDLWFPFANIIVQHATTQAFANTGIRPLIRFDNATNNVVAVTNFANAATVFTNVSGKFNPADRSIELSWTSGRWKVVETYKFLRER